MHSSSLQEGEKEEVEQKEGISASGLHRAMLLVFRLQHLLESGAHSLLSQSGSVSP